MLFKKSSLLHGPIFNQVYSKGFDKGHLRLQCTYCKLFNTEISENGRDKCKICFGKKTFEYLTAMALKRMELYYEVQSQYSSKECVYKNPLYFDFRLYPTLPLKTRFIIEVLEDWHTTEELSSNVKGEIKLNHAMSIREPIFYLYESDFGLNLGNEETSILNAINKIEKLIKLIEQVDNASGKDRDELLDNIYRMSPYFPILNF